MTTPTATKQAVRELLKELEMRPGTLDEYVVKEQSGYHRLNITEGDIVLDLGGNIGAFAAYAMKLGAAEVHTFEPEPSNLVLLRENVSRWAGRVVVHPTAVVGIDGPASIDLYVNDKKNRGTHATIPTKGRRAIRVDATPFDRALAQAPFTKIKCDIEGGEYAFNWRTLPDTVRGLVIELHLTRRGFRTSAAAVDAILRAAGWTATKKPKLDTKAWTALAAYER